MTPASFNEACAAHDWYHIQGGLARWRRGNAELSALLALVEADPSLAPLFEAWQQHAYSGPAWGKPSVPRPAPPIPVSTFPGPVPVIHPDQMELSV